MSEIRLALSYFICMMRERIVDSSAVYVEIFAERLYTDCRAFYMPAGISDTPRAVPFQLLIVEL